jgi:hypothetical protein
LRVNRSWSLNLKLSFRPTMLVNFNTCLIQSVYCNKAALFSETQAKKSRRKQEII